MVNSYAIVSESVRVNFSSVRNFSVVGSPRRSIQKPSLTPIVSTFSVSPSHHPIE